MATREPADRAVQPAAVTTAPPESGAGPSRRAAKRTAPAAGAPDAVEASSQTMAPRGYLLGYARVSTVEQDPRLQTDALAAADVDEVFVDHVSGVVADRPQLSLLLDRARPGDTVVVWRLDRLGRSTRHLLETVADLDAQGVGFRSLTEGIDTTTPSGRLLMTMLAALAEFERDLIVERTKAGLAAARARGRVGGRPTVMTPDKLAVARQLLAGGTSMTSIARTIGVSRPTLYTHLRQTEEPR